MESVDHDIRLSVGIDTTSAVKSMKKLMATTYKFFGLGLPDDFDKTFDSLQKHIDNVRETVSKYPELVNSVSDAGSEINITIQDTAQAEKDLAKSTKAASESLKESGEQFEGTEEELASLADGAEMIVEHIKDVFMGLAEVIKANHETMQEALGEIEIPDDEVSAKLQKLQNDVEKYSEKLELAKLKLQEFENQPPKPTSAYKSITKEFDKIGEEILKINNQKKAFKEDYGLGAEQLSGYKELNDQMGILIAKYERLKKKREEMEQSGTAFAVDDVKRQTLQNSLNSAERDYELAKARLEEYRTEQAKLAESSEEVGEAVENAAQTSDRAAKKAKKSITGFSLLLEPAIQKINRGNQYVKRMLSSLLRLGRRGSDSVKKVNGAAKNGIRTFMKYALSIGGLFAVLKKLQTTIAKSYRNLAQYSDEVNGSVSSLLSACTKLQNSLAAAFQPIENVVSPILSALIDKLSEAALAAGKFFAALTGQDFVYKALNTQEDYAGSLKDTAESAEEAEKALNDYLSPLDEINRYTSGKDKDKDTAVETGPAFEITPIEQRFKDLADKVKDYFGDFFEPFRASWSNKGSAVMEAWRGALERVRGTLADIAEDFKAVWTNGSGEKFVDKLLESFELLGEGVEAFVGAFQDAWNKDDLGQSVIQSMIDHATALLDLVNAIGRDLIDVWNAGYGERIWGNILTTVRNINKIIGGFYVQLKKAWDKNDKGRKIWEKILGIVEEVTNFFKELSEITVDWVDDLDFNPLLDGVLSLLDGFKKLQQVLNGKFKTVYEKILLPLAKWTIEKAVPKLLEAMGNALEFIADVIDDIPEGVLIGLASAIAGLGTAVLLFKGGQMIASGISAVAGALKLLVSTVAAHPIMILATAIAGITTAVIAYNELQWSNSGIQEFYSEVEKYSDDMAKISENMDTVLTNTDKTLSNTFADTKYLETYADRLKEIIADGQITPEEEADFRTIDKVFEERLPNYKEQIGLYITENEKGVLTINGDIKKIGTELDKVISKYKQTAIISAYTSLIEDSYKAIITGQDEYNKLLEENSDMLGAGKNYVEAMGELTEAYDKWHTATHSSMGAAGGDFLNQSAALDDLEAKMDELIPKALEAAYAMQDLGYDVTDVINALEKGEITDIWGSGMLGGIFDNAAPIRFFDELSPKVQDAIEQTEAAKIGIDNAKQSLDGMEGAATYFYGQIEENYVGALRAYQDGFITADEVMDNFGITVEELEKKAGEQGLTGTLAKSADSISADMENIESSTDKATEAISNLETETETPLSNTEANIESLAETAETAMSNMLKAITTAVQDSIKRLRELQEEAEKTGDKVSPIGAAGGALAGVAALQSALVKKKRTIPNIVNAPSIPKLAQGAVIPPNREFLAILGDQRSGRNFEAPESTLRQLIREELGSFGGNGGGSYQFTANLDGRVLFDKIIDRAKLKQTLTGKNPFELG